MNGRRGLGALMLLVAALGCGYRLSGTTSVLPEHIKSFHIPPFENFTARPEIEQRVTEAVARELTRRGRRYRIVADPTAADAILSGAVSSYQTNAVQFTSEGRSSRVEATIRLQATLRESATDQVLWSQGGLVFRQQYDVPPEGEYFDQESLALDGLAAGAAEALISSIFEGF